jgi:hypothetical protein
MRICEPLAALPHAPLLEHAEVLAFVERNRLHGRSIGWIDMNLLAAARVARISFWTQDKKHARIAHELHLSSSAD